MYLGLFVNEGLIQFVVTDCIHFCKLTYLQFFMYYLLFIINDCLETEKEAAPQLNSVPPSLLVQFIFLSMNTLESYSHSKMV